MGQTTIEEEQQITGLLILLHLKRYGPLWILACHTNYIFYMGFPLCLVPSIIALDEEKSLHQGLETYTLGFQPLS